MATCFLHVISEYLHVFLESWGNRKRLSELPDYLPSVIKILSLIY